MITATVLADSVSPANSRLTTLEVTFPRFILAEFNTHRVFSRNSASSRAIPVARILERVQRDPFVPKRFPVNRPGMSAVQYIGPHEGINHVNYDDCKAEWLRARSDAVAAANALMALDVHKQIANRLLEPFMWHTVIVSSTEWDNFFELRISEHAQPEMRETAEVMRKAIDGSDPEVIEYGKWHLPLINSKERVVLDTQVMIRSSVARVAAVSYDRHQTKDYAKEADRYDLLAANKHLSPFEHIATPSGFRRTWANFTGWQQARWFVERGLEVKS